MLIEVKVPQLSESVSEATLLAWHRKQGEYVQRDENLIDIETDKVVLELPAPQAGVLAKIVKGDGDTVVSNEVIATIDTDAKAPAVAKPAPVVSVVGRGPREPKAVEAKRSVEPIALPAARKLAAENKVDLSTVPGTGRGGRVTKQDVLAKLPQPAGETAPNSSALAPTPIPVDVERLPGDRPEQRVP